MKLIWKAACAAVLLAVSFIEIGCGGTYRPIATPLPVTTGNPAGAETEVVLNQCPTGAVCTSGGSVLTAIDVSGDSNSGNKVLNNVVGTVMGSLPESVVVPASVVSPIAFDASRSSVFTANTSTDSVTQVLLGASSSGFAANTSTISLDPGSAPIGMAFEYFGTTYSQDYVVNSNTGATTAPATARTCPAGVGSLGVIAQATTPATTKGAAPVNVPGTAAVKATICLATTANPSSSPVFAWIYKDQSKVFVLDNGGPSNGGNPGTVWVASASKFKVTNTITVGVNPTKATQSSDGNYLYVLNSGNGGGGSISIIDAQAETASTPVPVNPLNSSPAIDIAQVAQFDDTTKNSQFNHIWTLQADGTVSVFDATNPGTLTLITSLATGANPTNLALTRDGTEAYVGLGGTDQIVAIDTSKLASSGVTTNATTAITVGVHRSIQQTINTHTVTVETTTPTVNYVAVSRGGSSSDLSKAYASTTTSTTYNYYDGNGSLTSSTAYPNLYNGTAVVTALGSGTTPINTYVTTVPAPSVVTYCAPETGQFDGQKACPAMIPVMVLGRS